MAREEKSPCFGCKTRTAECHAICMAYFAWKTLHIDHSKESNAERNKYQDVDDFRIKQFEKIRRKRRR